jgi:hypothetical protein
LVVIRVFKDNRKIGQEIKLIKKLTKLKKGGAVMFWGKNNGGEKLSPPKNIPEAVGRYLVVGLGKNPDWVWNLKATLRNNDKDKDVFEVRVFDQSKAASQKIRVQDYTSLSDHPELILYEGWFNKKTFEVKIEAKG